MWYSNAIGGGRCPVVDTWWQTETGAIMIAPLPGITPPNPDRPPIRYRRGRRGVDDAGATVDRGGGYLTLTRPWPSMLRGIYGDPERYRQTYWSRLLAGTSPVMVPRWMRMAISGCSAGSTT